MHTAEEAKEFLIKQRTEKRVQRRETTFHKTASCWLCCQRDCKMGTAVHPKECEKGHAARNRARLDTPVCQKERQAKKVKCNTDLEHSVKQLRSAFATGPVSICVCCKHNLYKHSVVRFDTRKYQKTAQSRKNIIHCVPEQTNSYVCITCHRMLLQGNMPAQASSNNLVLPSIPSELIDLTAL